jgi:hypothetical protein
MDSSPFKQWCYPIFIICVWSPWLDLHTHALEVSSGFNPKILTCWSRGIKSTPVSPMVLAGGIDPTSRAWCRHAVAPPGFCGWPLSHVVSGIAPHDQETKPFLYNPWLNFLITHAMKIVLHLAGLFSRSYFSLQTILGFSCFFHS